MLPFKVVLWPLSGALAGRNFICSSGPPASWREKVRRFRLRGTAYEVVRTRWVTKLSSGSGPIRSRRLQLALTKLALRQETLRQRLLT